KFSKTFTTFFFPVGDEIRAIVAEWVLYLRGEKLWGNDDPLFPATRISLGVTRQFEASDVSGQPKLPSCAQAKSAICNGNPERVIGQAIYFQSTLTLLSNFKSSRICSISCRSPFAPSELTYNETSSPT
ncbi:MAG TPA: hypothetical protein VKG65_06955, partial [Terriglobales bacterium]|nr:hypothetical protein [Terriglobales bacterium]